MNYIIFKNKFNIKDFVNKIFKNKININSDKLQLGRWTNENSKRTKLKIDYANEDHCGICTKLLEKNISNK